MKSKILFMLSNKIVLRHDTPKCLILAREGKGKEGKGRGSRAALCTVHGSTMHCQEHNAFANIMDTGNCFNLIIFQMTRC